MSGATTQIGIVEWADRIESARALELQLAAVIGGWVPRITPRAPSSSSPATPVTSPGTRSCGTGSCPSSTTAPRGRRWSTPRSPVRRPQLAAATEPKGVYDDVLPLVVAAYRTWSGESTPIAERPVMRVLDLVLNDIDFDSQEGHDLFTRG